MFPNLLKERKKYIFLFFLLVIALIPSVFLINKKKEYSFLPLNLIARFTYSTSNKIAFFISDIKKYFNLKYENELLKEENTLLLNENRKSREYAVENNRLRNTLHFLEKTKFKLQVVSVIGRDLTNFFNTLIIDKGLEDGVVEDMAIVDTSGIVGKVVSCGKKISKVILLVDSNCSVCAINSRSRVYGVVSGTGGSLCIMKYVLSEDDVKIGDTIISSGEGEIFPKGFLIGRVVKVEKAKDELTLDIYIKPAVKFSILEEVFVVMK